MKYTLIYVKMHVDWPKARVGRSLLNNWLWVSDKYVTARSPFLIYRTLCRVPGLGHFGMELEIF